MIRESGKGKEGKGRERERKREGERERERKRERERHVNACTYESRVHTTGIEGPRIERLWFGR